VAQQQREAINSKHREIHTALNQSVAVERQRMADALHSLANVLVKETK